MVDGAGRHQVLDRWKAYPPLSENPIHRCLVHARGARDEAADPDIGAGEHGVPEPFVLHQPEQRFLTQWRRLAPIGPHLMALDQEISAAVPFGQGQQCHVLLADVDEQVLVPQLVGSRGLRGRPSTGVQAGVPGSAVDSGICLEGLAVENEYATVVDRSLGVRIQRCGDSEQLVSSCRYASRLVHRDVLAGEDGSQPLFFNGYPQGIAGASDVLCTRRSIGIPRTPRMRRHCPAPMATIELCLRGAVDPVWCARENPHRSSPGGPRSLRITFAGPTPDHGRSGPDQRATRR